MTPLTANTSRFELAVAGVGAPLRVLRLSGKEELSQPFVFHLEVGCEDFSLALERIVDQRAVLGILGDGGLRYVNGIVSRCEQGEIGQRFGLYLLDLVPTIWRMRYRRNCRIFQRQSAPEIIVKLLGELGLGSDEYRQSLQGQHPVREYCVQYRESELDFISRLMEEEGIFYYFEHADGKHILVMADHSGVHTEIAQRGRVRYVPRQAGAVSEEHVFSFRYAEELRPGISTLRDFNFKRPAQDLTGSARAPLDRLLEDYDYPGNYTDAGLGNTLAKVRLEELRTPRTSGSGASTCHGLVPGYTFTLAEFPRDDLNRKYLLTSVVTQGRQPQALEEGAGGTGSEFSNTFTCIPASLTYRPPRQTPRPVVRGAQTAIVVGPPGEEVYPDEFGRIKVQFHWDREGQGNEDASCWIRTSQAWAGTGWGAVAIPRIGQEVIVDFLEGDPDRPIVTGCVYHGTNRPPYPLPEHKTRTILKSRSSPGGNGFNEIRIEDKKSEEQIFIHAERNQDVRVKWDSLEWVGHDRHLIVRHDQYEKVEGDKHLLIQGEQLEKVEGDVHQTIAGDRMQTVLGTQNLSVQGDCKEAVTGEYNLKITSAANLESAHTWSQASGQDMHIKSGMNLAIAGGQSVHLKGGMNVVIEAGANLTIKAGGAFVNLSPAGVAISGTVVRINSGGSAGSGCGCAPRAPAPPARPNTPKPTLTAGDDKSGTTGPAKRPEKPPAPLKYGPQAITLKRAAITGTAFCRDCGALKKP